MILLTKSIDLNKDKTTKKSIFISFLLKIWTYLFEFYHNFSHLNHPGNLHSHYNENYAEYIHQNDKRVPNLNIVGERPFLREKKNQNYIKLHQFFEGVMQWNEG